MSARARGAARAKPPKTGDEVSPIARRKVYEEIVERLVDRIRAGEFAQGGALPSERQLMAQYRVGRPAVREALQTLQRMGLISITHGDRARLSEISAATAIGQVAEMVSLLLETSPGSLEQLKEARLFFEVGMACIAAEKATKRDADRLAAALDAQRAAVKDGSRFVEMDMAFHHAIADVSGNPIFTAVSRAMLEWLKRYYVGMLQVEGAERVTLQEHKRILDCIVKHDPEGAAKAMTLHLTRAARLYVRS